MITKMEILRAAKGMTCAGVARALEVTPAFIRNIEHGYIPSQRMQEKLEKFYGFSFIKLRETIPELDIVTAIFKELRETISESDIVTVVSKI